MQGSESSMGRLQQCRRAHSAPIRVRGTEQGSARRNGNRYFARSPGDRAVKARKLESDFEWNCRLETAPVSRVFPASAMRERRSAREAIPGRIAGTERSSTGAILPSQAKPGEGRPAVTMATANVRAKAGATQDSQESSGARTAGSGSVPIPQQPIAAARKRGGDQRQRRRRSERVRKRFRMSGSDSGALRGRANPGRSRKRTSWTDSQEFVGGSDAAEFATTGQR